MAGGDEASLLWPQGIEPRFLGRPITTHWESHIYVCGMRLPSAVQMSTLKKEAETSACWKQTVRRHISKDWNLNIHCSEHLKAQIRLACCSIPTHTHTHARTHTHTHTHPSFTHSLCPFSSLRILPYFATPLLLVPVRSFSSTLLFLQMHRFLINISPYDTTDSVTSCLTAAWLGEGKIAKLPCAFSRSRRYSSTHYLSRH